MRLAVSRHKNHATKQEYDLYRKTDSPLAYEEMVDVELAPTTESGFSEQQLLDWDNQQMFHRNV